MSTGQDETGGSVDYGSGFRVNPEPNGGYLLSSPMVDESRVPFDLTGAVADKPRKVALIGYTFSNRQAPWDVDGWELWGMNNMHTVIRDATWHRWFDLHDNALIDSDPEHVAWLRQEHPFPVLTMAPRPDFPSARLFPKDELVTRFGTYFTNTVSWQIAYAITQVEWARGDGAEIGLWGIDMAQGTEYAAQRPSCEYFMGLAEGMGIKVTVADTSDLLKTASLYGSTEGQAMRRKIEERITELSERLEHVRRDRDRMLGQARAAENAENQLVGALEQARYLVGTWFPPEVGRDATREANDIRAKG